MRESTKGYAFISPWLVGFLVFTLIPIGASLYYSFCDFTLLKPALFTGGSNYHGLFNDAVFWQALWNTLKYALLSLPLGLVMSLVCALLLNVNIRGQSIYRTVLFLPSLVPLIASAMLWLWLLNSQYGLINAFLHRIGIERTPNWLDGTWAMRSLVLMSLWSIGNTIVIYLAGLQDVPRELYEAAELDGANAVRRMWHVTLPFLSPVIFFNLVMGIIGTLQVFAVPYIMTPGGGSNRSTYFFTMYLYDCAFVYLKMGYASAMAWIQLLLVLAFTAIAFWSSKRWVHQPNR